MASLVMYDLFDPGSGLCVCQGKSALWSHLLHYQESKEKRDATPAGLTPPGKKT